MPWTQGVAGSSPAAKTRSVPVVQRLAFQDFNLKNRVRLPAGIPDTNNEEVTMSGLNFGINMRVSVLIEKLQEVLDKRDDCLVTYSADYVGYNVAHDVWYDEDLNVVVIQ